MTDQDADWKPYWPTCGMPGCIGSPLKGGEACIAHARPQDRQAFLAALKPGTDLDLRGVPVDSSLLSQLLDALQPQDAAPVLGHVQFQSARFSGITDFRKAQFNGPAEFDRAHFNGDTRFTRAQFNANAEFRAARFNGNTDFSEAQFNGGCYFPECTLQQNDQIPRRAVQ